MNKANARRATTRRRLVGWIAAALALGLVWTLWPRDQMLLARAMKVGKVDGWNLDARPTYAWVSNQELICWRSDQSQMDMKLCRHNVVTGRDIQIGSAESWPGTIYLTPAVSPDGKRILWLTSKRNEI